MKISVKKLYRGFASVRDYIVQKAIDKNEDLLIEYNGVTLTIKHSELCDFISLTKKKIVSKIDGRTYSLCDFPFEKRIKDTINDQCLLFDKEM